MIDIDVCIDCLTRAGPIIEVVISLSSVGLVVRVPALGQQTPADSLSWDKLY